MAQHNELGKKGEKIAVDFLLNNNYKILERNYRYLKAEVDIIAQKEDTLAIIEVKTRSSTFFGNPEEFVNPKKIKLLTDAANNYVIERDLDVEVRFDIIAVTINKTQSKIEHLKDAFLHF